MRIILKLSGEVLSGEGKKGYDVESLDHVVGEIRDLRREGFEVGVVVGAGNLVRGKDLGGISRVAADQLGMLATVMNSIYLAEALKREGIDAIVFSSIVDIPYVKRLDYRDVDTFLKSGVVLFGGGTSNPTFTTDTAAALRAVEMGAKRILKATKVDGVYDRDPKSNPDARKIDRLTFDDAIRMELEVMDIESFSICKRFGLEVVVFDFFKKGNTLKAARAEVGTLITPGDGE